MHILIIPSEVYASQESPLAGIFQQHQARALARAGYKVGVISIQLRSFELLRDRLLGWPQGVEVDSDQGIQVIRYHGWYWIPYIVRGKTWLTLRVGMRLFARYVEEHGTPDLIHAHNALYAGLLASRIKGKFGAPYVITEHSTAYARGLVSDCQTPYVREAFLNADKRFFVSSALGKILERFLGDGVSPWQCVPNILDNTFGEKPRIEGSEGGSRKPFRFLTIGNLSERKGHRDLLTAFALKFRGQSALQLRIGGEGPLRTQLERQAMELGIDNQLRFLGQLDREQVRFEMKTCHAFVLPSHYETFGVVLIEALSFGKPVISTRCGGPEEIVNPRNGVLVSTKDIVGLGEAMEAMRININRYDNVWIQEDCVSRFGENAVVGKLSSMYSEVCQQRTF
jgi:glycosyltransferase involved in cell wall biosynthesis